MYGVMYVGQQMPPLARDENVPPDQREGPDAAQGPPPLANREYPGLSYGTTFPAISRTFLPESGPAAIAVAFHPEHAYNFDAAEVFLASAWKGGFVDNQDHWRGNGNAYGSILGAIYYRSEVGFPFRFADSDERPKVDFLGYRLVEGGLPEFHYSMNDVQIHELIRESEGGGLERRFRVVTTRPLRFLIGDDAGVRFEASAGRWNGTTLELSAEQAREFTVTMTPERTSVR